MRMSSDMFPFASHEKYGYSLEYAGEELQKVGTLASELGHRLTTHVPQTNNLGSQTEKVVRDTIRDLSYHADMMDRMNLPVDSVMIIHLGGVYQDKESAIQRWEENFKKLPMSAQQRLVIENDEICYNVEEILPTCERLNIPLVLDYHHHSINPGTVPLEELIPLIKATWRRRGIRQKVHYSESRPNAVTVMERRAHSDYVEKIPMCGKDCDLMIEAKMKEQSVFHIYDKYNITYFTE